MKCAKCGFEDWEVIDVHGSIETWRCKKCGVQEDVHVYRNDLFEGVKKGAPVFIVVGRWKERASLQQANAIRNLFPALQHVQPSALIRQSFEGADFELGCFTEQELEGMRGQLDDLGVETRSKPISDPPG
jgi:hypothetical protein